MRKFIAVIILMIFVLGGCANTAKEKKAAAQKFPENLLIDTFAGSTCNGKVNVEITITTAYKAQFGGGSYLVFGKFRSVGSQKQTHETYLRGTFSPPGFAHPRSYWVNDGVLSLYSIKPYTLKEYMEENIGKGRARDMAYEEAKKNKKILADFEKQYGTPPFGNGAASQQLTVSLSMDITRDAEGKGWIGAFVGDGFDDCHEIVMASKSGKNTSQLAPVTGDSALRMLIGSNPNNEEESHARRLYWLKVAEQKGHVEAPFHIAQFYEKQGKKSPQSYQQALQYYRSFAEKTGDQRAQTALAKMYADGRGTPVNHVEEKKWRDLAAATLSKAAKVCASPKTIAAIYTIMKEQQKTGAALSILTLVVTGISVKEGDIRVTEIVAEDVATMDKPFSCRVYGDRVGASVDASSIPDVEYYSVNGYGIHSYQGDNSGDKAVLGGIANFANKMAQRPYNNSFTIAPLGDMRYTLRTGSYQVSLDLQTENIRNIPQKSSSKKELPPQKEQQTEQNPKIDDWAKDYFNKQ